MVQTAPKNHKEATRIGRSPLTGKFVLTPVSRKGSRPMDEVRKVVAGVLASKRA